MTDAAPDPDPATTDDGPAARLAALQDLDTEIDQLLHRREHLAEREALAAATSALQAWEAERTAMRTRLEELDAVIERSEEENAEIAADKERLQAQLKTVIAPREAEALMHEIDTLDQRRDGVETTEIEALESQSEIDDRLTAHVANESSLRDTMAAADAALAYVAGEIDADVARLTDDRDGARAQLDDSLLARYDRIRSSSGVAVARMEGRRCSGCHLDMSAAEADDVKDEAASTGGIADCPQCGRMLLV